MPVKGKVTCVLLSVYTVFSCSEHVCCQYTLYLIVVYKFRYGDSYNRSVKQFLLEELLEKFEDEDGVKSMLWIRYCTTGVYTFTRLDCYTGFKLSVYP